VLVLSRRTATIEVRNGDIRLATSDVRGPDDSSPSLVLMHGLGGSRRGMQKVAAHLPGWRVVSMDLRGHGRSDSAPWDFAGAVGDVEAVVDHFRLERPYVGGHSLGGMVALQYALSGHPVAGVINIDGWGPGIAGRFLDEDEAVVNAQLDLFATGKLSSRAAQAMVGLTRQTREGTTRSVLALLNRADVVAWHAAVPCRSLAFNAVAPASAVMARVLGAEMSRLQSAHRQGLRRDLAALAQQRRDVTVVEVDATHGLITTHPAIVASAITAFHEQRA
jgi:pimeloyl-ACP methyl ester carboxylesterase